LTQTRKDAKKHEAPSGTSLRQWARSWIARAGTLRAAEIHTLSRLSLRLCAFASKSERLGVCLTAWHFVALLSIVFIAATASAAESTLVIENTAIEKTLREQFFTNKGRFWLNNTDACNQSWLESPKVTASGGRLRIGALFSGRVGAQVGGQCVGGADAFNVTASGKPFYRDGRLGVEDIRIDSLSKEIYRPLLQPVFSSMVPKALDVNLKETVVRLLAGRTAPYEVEINELVATEVTADADRVNVRIQFDLRVR